MIAFLLALAVFQGGEPPQPAAEAPLIADPVWVTRPTGEDMAKAFPGLAQDKRVGGSAVLSCKVLKSGVLDACVVESEEPAEYGFGKASLKIAKRFRMKPLTASGQSVEGGTVRIPIVWNMMR